jgi:hypothetical protein
VLVTDQGNNRIRMLSTDLQQVTTVAGDDEQGHRDGAAAQARFLDPDSMWLLPDGRVLVGGFNEGEDSAGIRVLSADLQQVSTLTNIGELRGTETLQLLPDGRLLVSDFSCIRVLEGFPAALLGTKPSHKPPKKKNKRALAGGGASSSSSSSSSGGASSSGLVPKRSRSGGSTSAAAVAAPSSDSEGEEQPGGSAAEAEPLV